MMLKRDYTDVVGGALLLIFGTAWSLYSLAHYPIGTLNQMGSGMFPTALGVILAAFGAAIAYGGFLRTGQLPTIQVRTPASVLLGVAGFALAMPTFGMLPAVAIVTIVSSLAEKRFRPVQTVLLAAFLGALTWGIFNVALKLTLPMWRWPI